MKKTTKLFFLAFLDQENFGFCVSGISSNNRSRLRYSVSEKLYFAKQKFIFSLVRSVL